MKRARVMVWVIIMRGEWHCVTARSCSARAGVKRIYMRMPDSRTKASTCFAAAVLRRISRVEKFMPRSSTACFRRRRAPVNLVQTSITCSTVFCHFTLVAEPVRMKTNAWHMMM